MTDDDASDWQRSFGALRGAFPRPRDTITDAEREAIEAFQRKHAIKVIPRGVSAYAIDAPAIQRMKGNYAMKNRVASAARRRAEMLSLVLDEVPFAELRQRYRLSDAYLYSLIRAYYEAGHISASALATYRKQRKAMLKGSNDA